MNSARPSFKLSKKLTLINASRNLATAFTFTWPQLITVIPYILRGQKRMVLTGMQELEIQFTAYHASRQVGSALA